MRNTVSKKVSKMDIEIGKMHRELAKLYEERAKLMQTSFKSAKALKTSFDIDFPDEIIDELVRELDEKPRKNAKKSK